MLERDSASTDRAMEPAGCYVVVTEVPKQQLSGQETHDSYVSLRRRRSTILRPWYVLGPRHWWPYALLPLYRLMELIPATRDPANRLGLVTRAQMIAALLWAVENPAVASRVLEVPAIRRLAAGRPVS